MAVDNAGEAAKARQRESGDWDEIQPGIYVRSKAAEKKKPLDYYSKPVELLNDPKICDLVTSLRQDYGPDDKG